MDYILNGQANGDVAAALMRCNGDVGALRPWVGDDGRSYVALNRNGVLQAIPLQNATASLRKDAWKILDDAIVKAARERLRVVADLRGAGLTYTIPNGMSRTVLETEKMGDITDASISMDGMRESKADRPQFDLISLPLPIIHKDFHFSLRHVMASRNSGSPLDTTTAELAARKVADTIEKLTLGVYGSYAFGGGTIYGYTNFPNRLTATMTLPTAVGWTGATFLGEILGMIAQAVGALHYGPYKVYHSPNWAQYLDDDFSTAKGDITLRERTEKIREITSVDQADFLTGFTIILVQMTSDVVRLVNGMDITTVQWETKGGMQLNFKVMAIQVPQIRADINDRTGIVHGTAA